MRPEPARTGTNAAVTFDYHTFLAGDELCGIARDTDKI
jgi:hypothetical protein